MQKTKDELNSLMGLALNDRSYDYYENGYPIRDKLNKNKAEYIQALSEDIELFREYVEKENEFRALSYIIKNIEAMRLDIPVISCIFHKCEDGRIESSEASIDSDKVNRLATSAKSKLKLAYRVDSIWKNFKKQPEEKREIALKHTFAFETHKNGVGWESVDITLDGKTHCCRISDIGDSVSDFEEFVRELKDGNSGYFSWSSEPEGYTWFLSRRDPYIYAEIPGFSKGKFFYKDEFYRIICQDDLIIYSPHVMEIDQGTSTLVKYIGQRNNKIVLRIPQGVRRIGDRAFKDSARVEEVIIPDTVTEIGKEAFRNCSLRSIYIPDSVTKIGKDAFFLCTNLTHINIPKNLKDLEGLYSGYFDSWTVDKDNPWYIIIDNVIFSKDKTELIFYPCWKENKEYGIPNGVKKISENAFRYNAYLRKLLIPASVPTTEIDEIMFNPNLEEKKYSRL